VDASFWHDKWARGEIGFHEGQANAHLVAHFERLALPPGSRVFLPLCGKSRDLGWLLERGYRVVGIELSQVAISQLFEDLGLTPQVTTAGALTHYAVEDMDIFVGDVFALTAEALGPVDAIYDRAALVALPPQTRPRYAAHLVAIASAAPQLLVTFEYDQSRLDGPPFSVAGAEVEALYAQAYRLEPLGRTAVKGGLKGKVEADDVVWQLVPR